MAGRVAEKGIEAWFELDPEELLGDEAAAYEKVTDTLDVWFDSGVTHACVLRRREALAWPQRRRWVGWMTRRRLVWRPRRRLPSRTWGRWQPRRAACHTPLS